MFSDLCLVICKYRAARQYLNCSRLYSLNRQCQEQIANRQVIPPKCNKRFVSREELVAQASYTIKSHGSVVDLKHVLKNSGSTTTGQISCLLQWLENLPICLRFVLEKGKAVVTLFPNTIGQRQDLKDCSKEP